MKHKKVYSSKQNKSDQLVKTNSKDRSTYTYRFYGSETVEGKKREYYEEFEITPGEDGVTEEDIKALYAAEDSEVYYNLKTRHPKRSREEKQQIDEWEKEYARSFEEEHGYKPHPVDIKAAIDEKFPKNWTVSLDGIIDGDEYEDNALGDKSAILAKTYQAFDSEPGFEEAADAIAATWPKSWQELYDRVIKKKQTMVSIAKERNVSEGAVRKTVKRIREILSENPELRKFVRFFE